MIRGQSALVEWEKIIKTVVSGLACGAYILCGQRHELWKLGNQFALAMKRFLDELTVKGLGRCGIDIPDRLFFKTRIGKCSKKWGIKDVLESSIMLNRKIRDKAVNDSRKKWVITICISNGELQETERFLFESLSRKKVIISLRHE